MLSKSGKKLEEIIKKAIEDHVITTSEYEEIIAMANEDGVIDAHERVLLQQLNDMIADRTVKRIAG
ncbi:MAG: hypothetical protein BWZ01_01538 [Deltaproteobacteria bacterium ADurb.BinA179]|nr:hypothetical protein [Deltaproteobacteria bacterium]MDI9543148.1 hypothetical protein [Pseudomonadota bacterium]OPZ27661.1 MAG: hypothetical protein BWZ01_01538 [Deltaproteobacteria bacterium ADurb.BinA179]HRT46123.1 hypothetical protein [Desulfomonilia bacterium]HNU74430.1 hypothetical protein [Deltaproteobacteria bacterium]